MESAHQAEDGPSRTAANESVVAAELDGEAVLLNVDTGIYFGLDSVGTNIWKLLCDGDGVADDEIVGRLSAEYDVEPDQLRVDVAEFLGLLVSKGLARTVDCQAHQSS
jgi:hypothetical protein